MLYLVYTKWSDIMDFIKDLFRWIDRLSKALSKNRISESGAQISFFFFLSIFPFLIFLNMALALFSIEFSEYISGLYLLIPSNTAEVIKTFVEHAQSIDYASISLSALSLLWSASKGMQILQDCVDRIYEVGKRYNVLQKRFIGMLYLLGFLFIFLTNAIIPGLVKYAIDYINKYVAVDLDKVSAILFSKNLIVFTLLFIFVLIINYLIPNRRLKLRYVLLGSVFSTLMIALSSVAYSSLTKYALKISLIYGSLSSIIIFLMWLYLSNIFLLMGVQLNALILKNSGKLN